MTKEITENMVSNARKVILDFFKDNEDKIICYNRSADKKQMYCYYSEIHNEIMISDENPQFSLGYMDFLDYANPEDIIAIVKSIVHGQFEQKL